VIACNSRLDGRHAMNSVVLITSAQETDTCHLRRLLAAARDGPFDVIVAGTLAESLRQLSSGRVDIVLADFSLPDSEGIATFQRLLAAAPDIPMLAMILEADAALAFEAVTLGAQGYFLKGNSDNGLVSTALANIIHRKSVESALFVEKEHMRVILDSIGEAVIGTDLDSNISYLNDVAERMTGWPKAIAYGRPFSEVARIRDGATALPIWDHLRQAILHDQHVKGAVGMLLVRADGSATAIELSVAPVHERNGALSGAVIVLYDASAAQAATLAKMAYLAHHDVLTGLPNRLLLNERIAHAIALAKRQSTQLAVLFLDLDNFKLVNDSLGHGVGDGLLKSLAARLHASTRSTDMVSRQGGDEFIIVTVNAQSSANIAAVANKVLEQIALPHLVAGHQLHVTGSIGISVYPQDGLDAEALVGNADAAMYYAKKSGRGKLQFFNHDMNRRALERQMIEGRLRHAKDRGELVLHFQPKIDLARGAICGAEALLRWRRPGRRLILPDRFVRIAEECGWIEAIGHWVLREACRKARQWQDAGLDAGSIAVNVSACEFRAPGFLNGVRTVLAETGLEPSRLELELTEGVLMRNAESSFATLRALKDIGVQLVVDDFGTGYSSLSYLKDFPIDVLKIDQSFVRDLASPLDEGVIVKAVIGMSRNLNLKVVAEGVETKQQCQFLRALQCDQGQGFYFSRPLGGEQFARLLRRGLPARRNVALS
jgi:diguanylate cyclase (GGDEF)-like protein/PAS domain S-box-containing protein